MNTTPKVSDPMPNDGIPEWAREKDESYGEALARFERSFMQSLMCERAEDEAGQKSAEARKATENARDARIASEHDIFVAKHHLRLAIYRRDKRS